MSRGGIRNLCRPFDFQSDDFVAVWREIESASPRAAVIMVGASLEDALRWSMESRFIDGLTPDCLRSLFEVDGAPLGSFHSKISVGHALGMYGSIGRDDLSAIKRIRNQFAHASRSITFDTHEIAAECRKLSYLVAARANRQIAPVQSPTPTDPRDLLFATWKILYLDLHIIGSEYADQLGGMP
jgi:Domain of unknown function (DUF4145)